MRQVYYKSGLEGLPDHTVLELLLFFGIPMKDTNEQAHLLMNKFGSFSAVLQADINQLRSVKGMTENAACLLSMLLPVMRRYQDDLIAGRKRIISCDDVERLMRPKFIGSAEEKFFAVFTDAQDNLITVRLLNEGCLSFVAFDYRTLVGEALSLNAKNVILCHNHPSGIAVPGEEDVKLTADLAAYLKVIDIQLKDHVIIADNSAFSMASNIKFKGIFA